MTKGWKTYNNTAPAYTSDIDWFKVTFDTVKPESEGTDRGQTEDRQGPETDQTGGQIGGQIGGQSGQTGGQSDQESGQRKTLPKMTEKQLNILKLLEANPLIARKEISAILKINESAIQKHFESLKKKGVIERIGKTADSSWIILHSPEEFKE